MNEAALEAVRRNGSVVNTADIYNAMDRILQVTPADVVFTQHRASCEAAQCHLVTAWDVQNMFNVTLEQALCLHTAQSASCTIQTLMLQYARCACV